MLQGPFSLLLDGILKRLGGLSFLLITFLTTEHRLEQSMRLIFNHKVVDNCVCACVSCHTKKHACYDQDISCANVIPKSWSRQKLTLLGGIHDIHM